nr:DinB family protein [Bacillus sp. Marseille-P3661]
MGTLTNTVRQIQKDLIRNYIAAIHSRIDQFISIVREQPLDMVNWKPSEKEWSIAEIVCHVEEINRYWLNELLRVVRNPNDKWGRGLDDPERLAAVAASSYNSVEDTLAEISDFKTVIHDKLIDLDDSYLTLVTEHRNPKFGVKPLSFLLDHFMVEHLDGHIKQVERNIAKKLGK